MAATGRIGDAAGDTKAFPPTAAAPYQPLTMARTRVRTQVMMAEGNLTRRQGSHESGRTAIRPRTGDSRAPFHAAPTGRLGSNGRAMDSAARGGHGKVHCCCQRVCGISAGGRHQGPDVASTPSARAAIDLLADSSATCAVLLYRSSTTAALHASSRRELRATAVVCPRLALLPSIYRHRCRGGQRPGRTSRGHHAHHRPVLLRAPRPCSHHRRATAAREEPHHARTPIVHRVSPSWLPRLYLAHAPAKDDPSRATTTTSSFPTAPRRCTPASCSPCPTQCPRARPATVLPRP